jgi:hypothetical protein
LRAAKAARGLGGLKNFDIPAVTVFVNNHRKNEAERLIDDEGKAWR